MKTGKARTTGSANQGLKGFVPIAESPMRTSSVYSITVVVSARKNEARQFLYREQGFDSGVGFADSGEQCENDCL